MVNPEVFLNSVERELSQIDIYHRLDYVLCKSKYGAEFMLQMKKKYNFKYQIKMFHFTTIFPPLPEKTERTNECVLHLAGAHNWKNTPAVIKAWLEYPDLSPLILVSYGIGLKNLSDYLTLEELEKVSKSKNITWYNEEVPFDKIIEYKHRCRIHLCPSRAEGYGHYINEGRISKAVVITTDAPPMNELVTPNTGILIECLPSQFKRNGHIMCNVEPIQIYDAVMKALSLSDKDELGFRAFEDYQKDTDFFTKNLNTFLTTISQNIDKKYNNKYQTLISELKSVLDML